MSRIFSIDAHFHLDLFADPPALATEIEKAEVVTIAVTNAPSVFTYTQALARGSRFIRPAVGLHPELVISHYHELGQMLSMLPLTRFVGEIGLDYVTDDLENRALQRNVLSQILEKCALLGDRILTVHSRRSAPDVIASIGARFPGKVILHWFSGSRRDLDRAIDYGFYFSVGPAMVRSKHGLSLISSMPMDRVLTESDGPFVQHAGKPATPISTAAAVDELGKLWKVPAEHAKQMIFHNFSALEKLSDVPPL